MFVEPSVSKNGNKQFPDELGSACCDYTTKWKSVLVGPDQHGMERLRNENVRPNYSCCLTVPFCADP